MAPTIYNRVESGMLDADSYSFGRLGEPYAITIHHSAGPRAPSKARAVELNRAYQRQHINQGWGDIGYHASMDDLGRFYRLRPRDAKGAHVGGHNTGNHGLMIHGNFEFDELTSKQRDSIEWLFKGGLIVLFGEREAGYALARGHREWPGHTSNACPGDNLMRHWTWRRNKDFNPEREEA